MACMVVVDILIMVAYMAGVIITYAIMAYMVVMYVPWVYVVIADVDVGMKMDSFLPEQGANPRPIELWPV